MKKQIFEFNYKTSILFRIQLSERMQTETLFTTLLHHHLKVKFWAAYATSVWEKLCPREYEIASIWSREKTWQCTSIALNNYNSSWNNPDVVCTGIRVNRWRKIVLSLSTLDKDTLNMIVFLDISVCFIKILPAS